MCLSDGIRLQSSLGAAAGILCTGGLAPAMSRPAAADSPASVDSELGMQVPAVQVALVLGTTLPDLGPGGSLGLSLHPGEGIVTPFGAARVGAATAREPTHLDVDGGANWWQADLSLALGVSLCRGSRLPTACLRLGGVARGAVGQLQVERVDGLSPLTFPIGQASAGPELEASWGVALVRYAHHFGRPTRVAVPLSDSTGKIALEPAAFLSVGLRWDLGGQGKD